MHGGKCPKCENVMASVYIQAVTAKIPFQTDSYKAVSYQCPSCRTVLSVEVDFLALKGDIAKAVKKELGR